MNSFFSKEQPLYNGQNLKVNLYCLVLQVYYKRSPYISQTLTLCNVWFSVDKHVEGGTDCTDLDLPDKICLANQIKACPLHHVCLT